MLFAISFSKAQWEPDLRLTYDAAYSHTTYPGRNIASTGNYVHVVWRDARDGNDEIYYKRSTDNGTTWSNDTRLTYTEENSLMPYIAVSGQLVHIVYREDPQNIHYKRSTDNGATWETSKQLNTSGTFKGWASIAATGQNVHVAWHQYVSFGNYEIFYIKSTDNGSN